MQLSHHRSILAQALRLPRENFGGAMASDGGYAEPHRKSRKTEVGVDQQETESKAEGLDVDQQLQYIREGSPSDGRIGWDSIPLRLKLVWTVVCLRFRSI